MAIRHRMLVSPVATLGIGLEIAYTWSDCTHIWRAESQAQATLSAKLKVPIMVNCTKMVLRWIWDVSKQLLENPYSLTPGSSWIQCIFIAFMGT